MIVLIILHAPLGTLKSETIDLLRHNRAGSKSLLTDVHLPQGLTMLLHEHTLDSYGHGLNDQYILRNHFHRTCILLDGVMFCLQ